MDDVIYSWLKSSVETKITLLINKYIIHNNETCNSQNSAEKEKQWRGEYGTTVDSIQIHIFVRR